MKISRAIYVPLILIGSGFAAAFFRGQVSGRSTSDARAVSVIPPLENLQPMNGIDPKEAVDFWHKWHLVTTRYRKDNNQTRIIFANDIAWTAMLEGKKSYPDGSMLAKAIFGSTDDPDFPHSKIPTAYTLLEFMKKDSKSYPETDGWGFALYHYDPAKHEHYVIKEEGSKWLKFNCHSCHSIVRNRDFVYAMPAFIQWGAEASAPRESRFAAQFVESELAQAPGFAQQIVRHYGCKTCERIRTFVMPYFFTGQDLAIASVSEFTLKTGKPHVVISDYPRTFIFTYPATQAAVQKAGADVDKSRCVQFAQTYHSRPDTVDSGVICDSKVFSTGLQKAWYDPNFKKRAGH